MVYSSWYCVTSFPFGNIKSQCVGNIKFELVLSWWSECHFYYLFWCTYRAGWTWVFGARTKKNARTPLMKWTTTYSISKSHVALRGYLSYLLLSLIRARWAGEHVGEETNTPTLLMTSNKRIGQQGLENVYGGSTTSVMMIRMSPSTTYSYAHTGLERQENFWGTKQMHPHDDMNVYLCYLFLCFYRASRTGQIGGGQSKCPHTMHGVENKILDLEVSCCS